MAKYNFFGKKNCDKLKKNKYELKMLKLLENHVKTLFFLKFSNFGNIFENHDQKNAIEVTFWQKLTFWVKIFKNIA